MDIYSLSADELSNLIAQWNRDYYNGTPAVSDETWQAARDHLKILCPECPLLHEVGAPVDGGTPLKKRKHGIPMGSLSNAFEAADIQAWLKRINKLSEESGNKPPTVFVLQPKMDGFSLDLRYKDGVLKRAITRGDGIEGEDVTHSALVCPSIPKSLPAAYSIWVRGEVVIYRDDLAKHFPDYSNPRNAAAGIMRRLDGDGAKHLKFFAFDGVTSEGEPLEKTEAKTVGKLNAIGFQIAKTFVLKDENPVSLEAALIKRWEEFKTERSALPYDTDGFVCKINNVAKSSALGETDSCPRGMLAMKWRGSQVGEGTIVGIDNQVGRTGAITPVAIFHPPVLISGVSVTRASLANWSIVEALGICIGSRVVVERKGDVIPGINKVISVPDAAPVIQRPDRCPCCNESTTEDGPRQLCVNQECPARTVRAILNYIAQRGIMFFGPELVDKLSCLDGPLQNIDNLYDITADQIANVSGFVMAEKIMAEINRSKSGTLGSILGSVGIPGLGITEATKLVKSLNVNTIDHFICACAAGLKEFTSFGPEKINKVQKGTALREAMLRRLETHVTVVPEDVKTGPLSGQTYTATGESELSREEIKRIMGRSGATFKSSVVKGLNFVIIADPSSTSVKAQAARKAGVKLISEKEALDLAGYRG